MDVSSESGDLAYQLIFRNLRGEGSMSLAVLWRVLLLTLVLLPTAVARLFAATVTLPEIRVNTSSATSPTTFSNIIEPEQDPRPARSLAEIISRTAGTRVQRQGSTGQPSQLSIRGSSAEQVAVYLDGARINSGGSGSVDFSTIPLASIQQIEIIRGGGTTLFGTDAIGGVVNITTKAADPGTRISTSLGAGSFLTLSGTASLSRQTTNNSLIVSSSHHSSRGNYRFVQSSIDLGGTTVGEGKSFTRTHNRNLAESLLIKFSNHPPQSPRIDLTNNLFFTARQLPGLETETTQFAPSNPLEATQRLWRNSSTMQVKIPDAFTNDLDLTLGLHNTFEWSHFKDPSPALSAPLNSRTINDSINPYLALAYFIPTGSGSHTITTRYDLRHDIFSDAPRNKTTPSTGNHSRDTHSGLLQDEWKLFNDRLIFEPAIRLTNAAEFGTSADYRLGMIAQLNSILKLKANLETAERAPTLTELFHPDEGFIRGNPDLLKEKSWHWDGGLALETKSLKMEIDYFQQRISNSILFVPISAVTIMPINTFRVKADGIESTVTGDLTEWLHTEANYTWLRSHFTSTGNQLAGRPQHKFNGRIDLSHHLVKDWSGQLFADFQWISAIPLNVENTVFIGARSTLDLGGKLTWQPHNRRTYTAAFTVTNLTNTSVRDSRGFPLPRRAFAITISGEWKIAT